MRFRRLTAAERRQRSLDRLHAAVVDWAGHCGATEGRGLHPFGEPVPAHNRDGEHVAVTVTFNLKPRSPQP
jgi:hypothetical protein